MGQLILITIFYFQKHPLHGATAKSNFTTLSAYSKNLFQKVFNYHQHANNYKESTEILQEFCNVLCTRSFGLNNLLCLLLQRNMNRVFHQNLAWLMETLQSKNTCIECEGFLMSLTSLIQKVIIVGFYTSELLKAVETSLKILHFVRELFSLFFVSTLPDPQPS